MRVAEIAQKIGGAVIGNGECEIHRVKKIEDASEGDLSFIANPKYIRYAETTNASALIVSDTFRPLRDDVVYIKADDPYRAFVEVLKIFSLDVLEHGTTGIHERAIIDPTATIGERVSIGPNVVIGPGCTVGDDTTIAANTVFGADVSVGMRTTVWYGVTLYPGTVVGSNVIIHSGTIIGADGFGFVPIEGGGWEKIPQIGIVVIEDDVEIGANATIDRATLGETRICRGAKLDNLIHIAHNVVIGEDTVIAAQTGISGSTRIGTRNMIAGQVGIVGHIETAPGVIIEAQAGVSKSIRTAGRYFGHPAKEHSLALRQEGAIRQLPDLLVEIREMKNKIELLEAALGHEEESGMEE